MSDWLRWRPGRQLGVRYRKLLLARLAPWFDAYLLDYEPGTELPWHVDPVPGREHWRLNIAILRGGALLLTEREPFPYQKARTERVVFFRSDWLHMVTTMTSRRLVLSLGFTRAASDGA